LASYKWIIPGVLATSRMPTMSEVSELASLFKSIVILAEDHELWYNPDLLEGMGVRVFHKPIPDYTAPNIIDLHELVEYIDVCEKPTLVHCTGGRGRSGTIAVAYLMFSQGLSYREALYRARSIEPRFVETPLQHRVLRLYDMLLKTTPRKLLSRAIEIGRNTPLAHGGVLFGRGVRHAGRVLELCIELVEGFRETGLMDLSVEYERALYTAAILHDIGVSMLKPGEPDDKHREYSCELIMKHSGELDEACSCSVGVKAALIARLHGGEDPIPPSLDHGTIAAIGFLRIADGLDYTLNQVVLGLEVEKSSEGARIKIYCDEGKPGCMWNIERANMKKQLMESTLKRRITIEVYT